MFKAERILRKIRGLYKIVKNQNNYPFRLQSRTKGLVHKKILATRDLMEFENDNIGLYSSICWTIIKRIIRENSRK